MTDLKEQAKKIIAKGKALQDSELIQMGLDMLDQFEESTITENTETVKNTNQNKAKPKSKNKTPVKSTVLAVEKPTSTVTIPDFTMNRKEKQSKYGKSKSILNDARYNAFTDDKTEAMGPEFKTPSFTPTQRRPPVDKQKVEQTCEMCGKKDRVLPIYSREFYRCDACLMKGNKK